jgi:hypothetical protein
MKQLIRLLGVLVLVAAFVPSAPAKKTERPPLPTKIMQATSVFVDCVCPQGLAVARETALQQLQNWGRFQISEQRWQSDLIVLFSGNAYIGDYITRDGPDERPVVVDFTIMTVIDPKTGQSLWTDSRRWGSLRVRSATKDLIQELRQQMEDQARRWNLNDILACSVTAVYGGFAHLLFEEAVAKLDTGATKVSGTKDHLVVSSPEAPSFCKYAEFIFGPDRRIIGFTVLATRADNLDVGEVLEHADRFDFSGGKYAGGDQVYFNAQSRDQKILIQFNVAGHTPSLSLVSYLY